MKECRPSIVYHLAAIADPRVCENNPEEATAVNVGGTKNVFSSMPKGARGLHVSTCHVYGGAPPVPILANTSLNPTGVYAETKAVADQWVEQSMLPVSIARAFHHTGPGQSEAFALADWCAQIRRGSAEVSTGNLSVKRDYCDVRDIVRGYTVLATRGDAGHSYHLCSGRAEPMRTFLSWAIGSRRVRVVSDAERIRSGDAIEFRGDPTAAENLGWRRTRSLQQTLSEMASGPGR